MSQHDFIVDNAAGGTVRADINSALQALASLNAGTSAPSTTYAHMFWTDTTTGILKRRNAANSAWINWAPDITATYGGLLADPMTTRGDIMVRNSSNVTARLAVGSTNAIFSSDGTDAKYQSAATLGLAVLAGNQTLTGGFKATSYSNGTKSSGTFTPDAANGNIQHYTNGGAHTLAPPSNSCSIILECTNASAGALTTSGFSIVSGDTYSSSGTKKHIFYITKTNSYSHLHVVYVTGT